MKGGNTADKIVRGQFRMEDETYDLSTTSPIKDK